MKRPTKKQKLAVAEAMILLCVERGDFVSAEIWATTVIENIDSLVNR